MTNAEIDKLVAEKIMGWTLPEETITYWSNWRDANGNELRSVKAWQPTSDIAQAWQVIEKLSQGGNDFDTWKRFSDILEKHAAIHYCSLWGFSSSEASRIICMAALRALGVEVSE